MVGEVSVPSPDLNDSLTQTTTSGPDSSSTPQTDPCMSNDKAQTCTKGSSVVTLSPFEFRMKSSLKETPVFGLTSPPPQRRKRTDPNNMAKNVKGSKVNHEVIPGKYEAIGYEKYLTIKLSDSDADVFKVYRDIVECCGRKPKISPQKKGELVVETNSVAESRKMQNMSILGGVQASCTPHLALNCSKGIVYAPQLLLYSEERLEQEFKDQGVIKVERMKKKVNGVPTPLPNLILTFNSFKLPDILQAAWFRFKIKLFIPRPRRCFYCQRFGHVLESCRLKMEGKKPVCVNCSEDEHGRCQKSSKCIHCGGNHPSSYKGCDVFIFEKEVQATRVSERVTFAEARHLVQSRNIRPGTSFAKVVADSRSSRKNLVINQQKTTSTDNRPHQQSNPRIKRALSRESVDEPPAKLALSGSPLLYNKQSDRQASYETALALAGAVSSLEAASTVVDAASAVADAPASSEAASVVADAPASSEAASALADAPASSEAASALADAPASLEAASAVAGARTSLETMSAMADVPASVEVASAVAGAPASSEAALAPASASTSCSEAASQPPSLEVIKPCPMETDLASQTPAKGSKNKKLPIAEKTKTAAPAKAQRNQNTSSGRKQNTSSSKKLVRNPAHQGSKMK